MDAAKASAASGTRHWRSVRKTLSLKAPRSGIMNRQKARVPRATATEPPLVVRSPMQREKYNINAHEIFSHDYIVPFDGLP
ncbi:hypothetical protein EH203_10165 [Pectobacterium carotovorum subsp. carotovorum]|nr:hypothetical protein EH203_10165 [Pectobacterium carotovorum subsp. carotovorum]